MKTLISSFVAVVLLLAMAVPAEAQYRGYVDPYGVSYEEAVAIASARRAERGVVYTGPGSYPGGYDRAAQISAAIRGDYSGGGGYGYNPYHNPRMYDPCFGADQYIKGMRGTMHANKGAVHFRPCDPTNGRVSTGAGGALASAGGAAIGAATAGRKGAAIGAVGGAIIGGILASRNAHENCIIIEPGQMMPREPETSAQNIEREEPTQQPVQVADVPVKKIIRNRFEDAPIRLYDGASKIFELKAGDDGMVELTSSSQVWGEAYLKNPSNGKMEWVPLQLGKGVDPLPQEAGWVLGNPTTRPTLN